MRLRPLLLLSLSLLTVSCARKPAQQADAKPDPVGQLRKEVSDLASPKGCKVVGECRVADVGYNSCGGPRVYMVYCGSSTDPGKLSQKLADLEKAEKDQSTDPEARCIKPKKPEVELAQGLCRAK